MGCTREALSRRLELLAAPTEGNPQHSGFTTSTDGPHIGVTRSARRRRFYAYIQEPDQTMAVSINTGLVDTADPVSNELKIDMREKIAMLDPDVSQFSTMLMKLPQERAKSFKVEYLH